EHTFESDQSELKLLEDELVVLSHKVAQRLRRSGKLAEALAIKIKYQDFTTVNRSKTLPAATDSPSALTNGVLELFRRLLPLPQAVRLVGVRAERLGQETQGVQLSLDPIDEKTREAEKIADSIALKFPSQR